MTPTKYLVLLYIAGMVHQDKGYAWPSRVLIATSTGMGVRTVTDILSDLVELGALVVTRRPNKTNRYELVGFAAAGGNKAFKGKGGLKNMPVPEWNPKSNNYAAYQTRNRRQRGKNQPKKANLPTPIVDEVNGTNVHDEAQAWDVIDPFDLGAGPRVLLAESA